MQGGRIARLHTEFITKDDYGRLAEFDALFIRETTSVNHHTYRFARTGGAEGLGGRSTTRNRSSSAPTRFFWPNCWTATEFRPRAR